MAGVEPVYSFDDERSVSQKVCGCCGKHYTLVKGFVLKDAGAEAIYLAALHCHDDQHEAWIDVVFGSFGEGDSSDHVTFGCRVGPVEGQESPAATAVQAAIPYGDAAIFGLKLDRDAALSHPWISRNWEVVDFLLVADPDVNRHVYSARPSGGRNRPIWRRHKPRP